MSVPRRSFAIGVTIFVMAATVFTISAQAQQVPAQPPPPGPVYVVTHVDIIGGQQGVADAIKLMHDFQVDSLKDPGAVRFEVMEQDNRLNHFAMVEVWQSREAYDAHQGHDHSRRFREKIGPMLGSPFDVRLHRLMP
jgi:quinol monooxygenase YgiN